MSTNPKSARKSSLQQQLNVPTCWKVFAETLQKLFQRIRACLLKCREYRLTMGIKKFKICYPGDKIRFGGYLISAEGFFPDDRKVSAIVDFPQPENQTDIKSFLGLSRQLAPFVTNLQVSLEAHTPWGSKWWVPPTCLSWMCVCQVGQCRPSTATHSDHFLGTV